MSQLTAIMAGLLLVGSSGNGIAAAPCEAPHRLQNTAQRQNGLDPRSALATRLALPSSAAIDAYLRSGVAFARPHHLTSRERIKVEQALLALPTLHRHILQGHLRHLSFIDAPDGAGNGLTAVVNDGEFPIFDLTLRAGILNESLSRFLTVKEQTAFEDDGSGAAVSVDAAGDALTYVLLHETSHVVDRALGVTADPASPFTAGIWQDRTRLNPHWVESAISRHAFRRGAKLPASEAPTLYAALEGSPFTSLYATAAAPEDFAELVAWRELSRTADRPLQVVIRNRKGNMIYSLEPLRRSRIDQRFAEVGKLLDACMPR